MTSVTEWQRALRASDLPLATKGLLYTLSTYADWTTGEHIRPGEKLQDECHIPPRTAYRHIKPALDAGWLVQTCHGSTAPKRTWANEYRLAVPDHFSTVEHGPDHRPDVADDQGDATDHRPDVADDQPTIGHSGTDHRPDVAAHLDITPSHKSYARHSDETHSDRAKDSAPVEVVPWDGDLSRLAIPFQFDPGAREYYVRPDGTIRPVRGLPRPGEVRATLDLRDISLTQAIQAELAVFGAQRAGK
jgi:hypothetical protein